MQCPIFSVYLPTMNIHFTHLEKVFKFRLKKIAYNGYNNAYICTDN